MSSQSIAAQLPTLKKYLQQTNDWNKIFGQRAYDITCLTEADIKELRAKVECELSPENLCCDGEAPAAHVRDHGRYLNQVLKELDHARGY